METGKKMRAGAIKRRFEKFELEHTKLLFLIDEVQDKIDELSAGEVIGAEGEKYVRILDELCKADDMIAEGIRHIKRAVRLNGEIET